MYIVFDCLISVGFSQIIKYNLVWRLDLYRPRSGATRFQTPHARATRSWKIHTTCPDANVWRSSVKRSKRCVSWANPRRAEDAATLCRQMISKLWRCLRSDRSMAKFPSPEMRTTVAGLPKVCAKRRKLWRNLSSAAFLEVALMCTTVT